MVAAVLLALEHAGAHLAAAPSGLVDLVAGWPLAALIFIARGALAGARR